MLLHRLMGGGSRCNYDVSVDGAAERVVRRSLRRRGPNLRRDRTLPLPLRGDWGLAALPGRTPSDIAKRVEPPQKSANPFRSLGLSRMKEPIMCQRVMA